MSRIVCNTGPLIALGVLNRLDILKSLFSEVLIPEAVQKKLPAEELPAAVLPISLKPSGSASCPCSLAAILCLNLFWMLSNFGYEHCRNRGGTAQSQRR